MPVLERDNLWILSKYGMTRDWINSTESDLIWPTIPPSIFHRAYICENKETIENLIRAFLRDFHQTNEMECVPLHVKNDNHIQMRIVRNNQHVNMLFPERFDINDVSSSVLVHDPCTRFIVCVEFCTIRLDDVQHMILSFDDALNTLWRVKTVEEDFIETQRRDDLSTIELRVRRSIFLFRDDEVKMSIKYFGERRCDLYIIFYSMFSPDVVDQIAKFAFLESQITPRDFRQGACSEIFTYSIARLIRVAWMLGEGSLSLDEFWKAKAERKKKEYTVLKKIYRRRKSVFDRQPMSKVLRSGLLC